MRILEKGQLPEQRMYKARCDKCQTLFEFRKDEAKEMPPGGYSNNQLATRCPLTGCDAVIYVNE